MIQPSFLQLSPFDPVHIVQAIGIGTDSFIDDNAEHVLKLFSSNISQGTKVKFNPRRSKLVDEVKRRMNKYGVSENGWTKRYDQSTLKPNNWSKSKLHQYLKFNPVTDANEILVINMEMESLLHVEIFF